MWRDENAEPGKDDRLGWTSQAPTKFSEPIISSNADLRGQTGSDLFEPKHFIVIEI